jgi:hypothetical protein
MSEKEHQGFSKESAILILAINFRIILKGEENILMV